MELASNLSTPSAYNLPEITRQAARVAILAHDPTATDILEILGLDVSHGNCECCPDDGRYDGK